MTTRTRRPWTPAEERRLEELVENGLRMREIAAAMGRTEASIACKVARMGLELLTGRGRPRTLDYAAIGAMLDEGARVADIVAVHGRRAGRVAQVVRR